MYNDSSKSKIKSIFQVVAMLLFAILDLNDLNSVA
jgi:hypothetical protein